MKYFSCILCTLMACVAMYLVAKVLANAYVAAEAVKVGRIAVPVKK